MSPEDSPTPAEDHHGSNTKVSTIDLVHSASSSSSSQNDPETIAHLCRFRMELIVYLIIKFSPKFILEVWGGAGAIWGFSEVVGLRTEDTLYFWRPAAMTLGGLFFIRFIGQLATAAKEYPKGNFAKINKLAAPIWDVEVGADLPNTDETHGGDCSCTCCCCCCRCCSDGDNNHNSHSNQQQQRRRLRKVITRMEHETSAAPAN